MEYIKACARKARSGKLRDVLAIRTYVQVRAHGKVLAIIFGPAHALTVAPTPSTSQSAGCPYHVLHHRAVAEFALDTACSSCVLLLWFLIY